MRAEQTVRAINRKYKIRDALAPGAFRVILGADLAGPAAGAPVPATFFGVMANGPLLGLLVKE